VKYIRGAASNFVAARPRSSFCKNAHWAASGEVSFAIFAMLDAPGVNFSLSASASKNPSNRIYTFSVIEHFDFSAIPGFEPEIGILTAALIDGTREWRDEMGTVDLDSITWQARPGGHSIGSMMLHIANVEEIWVMVRLAGIPQSEDKRALFQAASVDFSRAFWPTPPPEPLEYYYSLQDEVRTRTLEILSDVRSPDQVVPHPTRQISFTPRWMLNHLIGHEAYHAGQAILLDDLWRASQTKSSST
jgi:uncharacterized damage-inducible protein DinB